MSPSRRSDCNLGSARWGHRALPLFACASSLDCRQLCFDVVAHERFENGIEIAFDKCREVVERDVNAMIGDAVLRKIVGADFLAALAGANLSASLGCVTSIFLGNFSFEQARAKDGQGACFVLLLRTLIGATNDQ